MSTASPATDLPQTPATIADEQIGVNGVIAVALTRSVGSMPALYAALVIVGGWMALASWGPLHRIDPYPFRFLLFLDNVVQLVLCLVILVGQRVLGVAADHRAVQTYENAEAIFEQVVDLQEHLDRHDRSLSRGVSLLEWSPHPWIERHRVQPPPQAIDQAVTVNGRIAAWLTEAAGHHVGVLPGGGDPGRLDRAGGGGRPAVRPYPFAFMSFLSTLAQLIFMIVIMVGQDVLGRAADRRSEQTFLDAKAILHECRRMKARLTTQDRILASLTSYVTVQVTEHLARAIHDDYGAIHESGPRGRRRPQPGRRRRRPARPLGRAARGVQGVQPRSGPADRREAGRHRLPHGAGLRPDPRASRSTTTSCSCWPGWSTSAGCRSGPPRGSSPGPPGTAGSAPTWCPGSGCRTRPGR